MSFRTKINPPNDFEMKIMDFPPSLEDLYFLHFPRITHGWAENPQQQLELFTDQYLQDFEDVRSFVKAQINEGHISFIQVYPGSEPDNGYRSHYICFGVDPDNLGNSISFRIDQNWIDFKFPQTIDQSAIRYLKAIVPSLSGVIVGRLDFPEIILSKYWMENPRKLLRVPYLIKRKVGNYFLLATDYWGEWKIMDKLGVVWLWHMKNRRNFEIRSTGLCLKEWCQAELKNPFRPRPKPEWIREKSA